MEEDEGESAASISSCSSLGERGEAAVTSVMHNCNKSKYELLERNAKKRSLELPCGDYWEARLFVRWIRRVCILGLEGTKLI